MTTPRDGRPIRDDDPHYDNDEPAEMELLGQCMRCRHKHPGQLTCDAYPHAPGVPDEILAGAVDHRNPYPGDHGIRFSPIGGGE